MTTKKKRTPKKGGGSRRPRHDAERFLEKLTGGPLTFGEMLWSIRLGEEMTQAGLAQKLGTTRAHICDIEKGRKVVGPARAAKFARVLGYSEAQFVRLALQAQLTNAGLKLVVRVDAA